MNNIANKNTLVNRENKNKKKKKHKICYSLLKKAESYKYNHKYKTKRIIEQSILIIIIASSLRKGCIEYMRAMIIGLYCEKLKCERSPKIVRDLDNRIRELRKSGHIKTIPHRKHNAKYGKDFAGSETICKLKKGVRSSSPKKLTQDFQRPQRENLELEKLGIGIKKEILNLLFTEHSLKAIEYILNFMECNTDYKKNDPPDQKNRSFGKTKYEYLRMIKNIMDSSIQNLKDVGTIIPTKRWGYAFKLVWFKKLNGKNLLRGNSFIVDEFKEMCRAAKRARNEKLSIEGVEENYRNVVKRASRIDKMLKDFEMQVGRIIGGKGNKLQKPYVDERQIAKEVQNIIYISPSNNVLLTEKTNLDLETRKYTMTIEDKKIMDFFNKDLYGCIINIISMQKPKYEAIAIFKVLEKNGYIARANMNIMMLNERIGMILYFENEIEKEFDVRIRSGEINNVLTRLSKGSPMNKEEKTTLKMVLKVNEGYLKTEHEEEILIFKDDREEFKVRCQTKFMRLYAEKKLSCPTIALTAY